MKTSLRDTFPHGPKEDSWPTACWVQSVWNFIAANHPNWVKSQRMGWMLQYNLYLTALDCHALLPDLSRIDAVIALLHFAAANPRWQRPKPWRISELVRPDNTRKLARQYHAFHGGCNVA